MSKVALIDSAAQNCARIPEWRWLAHSVRPNGLLLGSEEATAAIVRRLDPLLRPPVAHWPRDGAAWAAVPPPSTLILHDVAAMTPGDQACLLASLRAGGGDMQIISLTSRRLYPLVRRGQFLDTLYYLLNHVVVQCPRSRVRRAR